MLCCRHTTCIIFGIFVSICVSICPAMYLVPCQSMYPSIFLLIYFPIQLFCHSVFAPIFPDVHPSTVYLCVPNCGYIRICLHVSPCLYFCFRIFFLDSFMLICTFTPIFFPYIYIFVFFYYSDMLAIFCASLRYNLHPACVQSACRVVYPPRISD